MRGRSEWATLETFLSRARSPASCACADLVGATCYTPEITITACRWKMPLKVNNDV